MIIDSSAVISILRLENDHREYLTAIIAADRRLISAPNYVEIVMVFAGSQRPAILERLDSFLRESAINIIPFTANHALAAREAFLRYGKGRHPAGLNFGDCIAYATAKLERMPLLFKGEDFRRTDVEPAL